jgi:putative phosphoesterase
MRLTTADLVIHAGDFTRLEVVEQLRVINEVVAVHGNMDEAQVREELPVSALMNTGEHRIAIIHDAGPTAGRLRRMQTRFPEADAVIFGHSHIPLHERAPDGFQIFNPGSPTDRRRAPHHTMGICDAAGGELRFQLVELD